MTSSIYDADFVLALFSELARDEGMVLEVSHDPEWWRAEAHDDGTNLTVPFGWAPPRRAPKTDHVLVDLCPQLIADHCQLLGAAEAEEYLAALLRLIRMHHRLMDLPADERLAVVEDVFASENPELFRVLAEAQWKIAST